jgi:hypothetical protein
MSRFASLCAGLLLVSSLSGCCLFGHGAGYSPYGGGCNSCSPCQSGACGAMAPGYPSASIYNPGVPQAAFMQPQGAGYAPQMVMTDTLPTY